MVLLKLTNVEKQYPGMSQKAVSDISLDIDAGETIGLTGDNGAGKSTLLSMMATLIRPTGGVIAYDDRDIATEPGYIRSRMGYVPQRTVLYETLSAEENLDFWSKAYHVSKERLISAKQYACDFVAFPDSWRKKRVSSLSGGMKRRLNVAVALLQKPRLLLLDEPSEGMDAQSRRQLIYSLKEFASKGGTVVYVGHIADEINELCDKVCTLEDGHMQYFGIPVSRAGGS
jgi:ABC-2 type transport system ATP-binding protein